MKKIILFLGLVATILSCSSDNNDDIVQEVHHTLSPPDWIQGTWWDNSNSNSGVMFLPNELCTIYGNPSNGTASPTCWVEHVNENVGLTLVEEIKTSNEYKVKMNLISANGITIHFKRLSATTMQGITFSGDNPIYTKQ